MEMNGITFSTSAVKITYISGKKVFEENNLKQNPSFVSYCPNHQSLLLTAPSHPSINLPNLCYPQEQSCRYLTYQNGIQKDQKRKTTSVMEILYF